MMQVKRMLSMVLVLAMCCSLLPSQVMAADEGALQIVAPEKLDAAYNPEAGEVAVKALPEEAATVILAGYDGGQMTFAKTEDSLAPLPVRIPVPQDTSFDTLKVFCLDGQNMPLTQASQVYCASDAEGRDLVVVTYLLLVNDIVSNAEQFEPVYLERGEMLMKPEDPVSDYAVFAGWYTDLSHTEAFDFAQPVTEDTFVVAKWEIDETDTDGDGLFDGLEAYYGTDKAVKDTDSDGLSDYLEAILLGVDPLNADSDGNGTGDADEDADGDGLTNLSEIQKGTSLILADTDRDGLSDAEESQRYGTDPLIADTDGDGASDGAEIASGTEPKTANNSFQDSDASLPVGAGNPVAAMVEANVPGEALGTVTVSAVTNAENMLISESIPGYLGYAYELDAAADILDATVTFTYDSDLGTVSDDFLPAIYWLNEETQELVELPSQTVSGNSVTAELEHFSTYLLLNKVEYEKDRARRQALMEQVMGTETVSLAKADADLLDDRLNAAIYYGVLTLADGSAPFFGVDFSENQDMDGDGLLNGEEIRVVSAPNGGFHLYMMSNPLLADTDGDGIEDRAEQFEKTPLNGYTYDSEALERLKMDNAFAHILCAKELLGTDLTGDDSWHNVYTALGYFDYGGQDDVFVYEWLEYMHYYVDDILQSAQTNEMIDICYENGLSITDSLNAEALSTFKANLDDEDLIGVLETGMDTGGLTLDLADIYLETTASAMIKQIMGDRADIIAELMELPKYRGKSLDALEKSKQFCKKLEKMAESKLSSKYPLKFHVKAQQVTNKLGKAAEKAQIVMGVISTANDAMQIYQTWERFAQINANTQGFETCIGIFENLIDEFERPEYDGVAVSNILDASEYMVEKLKSESMDFSDKRNDLMESATQGMILDLAAFVVELTELVALNPLVGAVVAAADLLIDYATSRAHAYNQVIAVAFLAHSVEQMMEHVIDDDGKLMDPNAKAAADTYLAHLAHLRLVGELKYNAASNDEKMLKARYETVIQKSEELQVWLSKNLLLECDSVMNPNVVCKVSTMDYQPQGGYAGDMTGPVYAIQPAIFVDGYLVNRAVNQKGICKLALEPGVHEITIAGYSADTHQVVVQKGQTQNVEFHLLKGHESLTYDMSATVTAGDSGSGLQGATVSIREGHGQKTDAPIKVISTDSNGVMKAQLAAGCYTAEIAKPEYQTRYVEFTLSGDPAFNSLWDTFKAALTLCDAGTITGTVTEADLKTPIANVTVYLVDAADVGNYRYGGKTDENGRIEIKNVMKGKYNLLFAADGYLTASYSCTVSSAQASFGVKALTRLQSEFTVTHPVLGDVLKTAAVNGGIELCNNVGVANWTVSGVTSITKAGDWFDIEETQNSDGSTNLRISVNGHTLTKNSGSITFHTVDGLTHTVIVYQQAYTLSGTVVAGNTAVKGATVVVWNTDGFQAVPVKTGADGTFSVRVYDAYYSVTVTAEGYAEKTVTVPTPVAQCHVNMGTVSLNLPTVAQGSCGENLTWRVDADLTLTISGTGDMYDYTEQNAPWYPWNANKNFGNVKRVVVEPGVTSIGGNAFYLCQDITSVSLPYGITRIGGLAFYLCSMSEITIPETVQTIGASAFASTGLTSVYVPASVTSLAGNVFYMSRSLAEISVAPGNAYYCSVDGVLFDKGMRTLIAYPANKADESYDVPAGVQTIGENAFYWCQNLKNVTMPEGLTSIAENGFYASDRITSMVLPSTLETIGAYALYMCSYTELQLPESLTTIGRSAFSGNRRLKTITIPAAVTEIGSDAFYDCPNLQTIEVESGNQKFRSEEGVLFSKDGRSLIKYPGDYRLPSAEDPEVLESVTDYVIPDGVQSVEQGAFTDSMKPYGGVHVIEGTTYTYGLQSITFPQSVEKVLWNDYANEFHYITDLIFLGKAPADAKYYMLDESEPKSVLHFMADQTESIDGKLNGWTAPVWTPHNVSNMGFNYKVWFRTVCDDAAAEAVGTVVDAEALPLDGVTVTVYDANEVVVFETVTDSEGMYSVQFLYTGSYMIRYSKDGWTPVEKTVSIRTNTKTLDEISMEQGATIVASGTYYYASWVLDSDGRLVVSGKIGIDDYAWIAYKGQVRELVIESGIERVDISNSYTYIDGVKTDPYLNLTRICLSDTVSVLELNATRNNYELLEAIDVDANNPYYSSVDGVLYNKDQTTLIRYPLKRSGTSFDMPDTVKTVEAAAFYGCGWMYNCELTNITLSDNLENVGDYAFYQAGISNLTLPGTLKSVGEGAFQISMITSVHVPASLTSIGKQALGDSGLVSITVDPNNPAYAAVDGVLFTKDMKSLVQYPRNKKGTSYQVPDGVTAIGEYAFYNVKLVSIYVPDSVETLGAYAMYRYSTLEGVYFYGEAPANWDAKAVNSGATTIYYIEGKAGWTSPTWIEPNTGTEYTTAVWVPEV